MRIDKINQVTQLYSSQTVAPHTNDKKRMEKDKVSLSEQAKDFQSAYKLAKESPEIRAEKVQDIKERIQSGTYRVDAREVSEKIVRQLDLRG